MEVHHVAILPALVAALTGFVIGGLWYGPLFRTPWMKHSGMSFEKGRQQNVALVFGLTYVLNVVVALGLQILMPHGRGGFLGVHTGVFAAAFFVITALGVIYLFESKPFALWAINAGYQLVNFAAMGAVLGAWPG